MIWWLLLIPALAAAGVYANSIRNEFAYDDLAIVQDNVHVMDLDWTRIWTDNYWPMKDGMQPDVLYRPLTIWTYLANQALAPGAAWAFHLTNVVLHVLTTVMVVILTLRLFGKRSIALLTGLFFALHPIHTEVVANVVGRAEMLAAIWSLAALLIYLPEEPTGLQKAESTRPYWHGWLVAACFFAAMLSKETPAALLFVFVLIDLWRWHYSDPAARPKLIRWIMRQTWRYYFPLGMVFALYLGMRIHASGLMRDIQAIHPLVNPLVAATAWERVVTPFVIFTKYLSLTVWPAVLSADYSSPSIMPTANPLAPAALIGILTTALAVIWAVRYRKSASPAILTLGFFAMSYALVANVLRIGTIMGERLFYMPSVFVLMLAAWGLVLLWETDFIRRARSCRIALCAALLAACGGMGVRTIVRNTDWHDNVALAIATARDNLASAKACYWAGSTLTTVVSEKWMQEFGVGLLERSIQACPNYPDSYWELAKYYGRKNDEVKSTVYLAEAAIYNPGARDLRFALGSVGDDLKAHDSEHYLPGFEKYVHENPMAPEGRLAYAIGLRSVNKYEEAERQCRMALRLNGNYMEAIAELAMIRLDEGKTQDGVAILRGYVMRINSSFDARCTMVKVLMGLDAKEFPQAMGEAQMNLNRAAILNPGDVKVRELQAALTKKQTEINKFRNIEKGQAGISPKGEVKSLAGALR